MIYISSINLQQKFTVMAIKWSVLLLFGLQLSVNSSFAQTITGGASYYARSFEGRKTANGEKFSNYDMTCASRKLPFHTFLKITNLKNNLTTIVRVNDRGPYAKQRVVDLSEQAARIIGIYKRGVTRVKMEIIKPPLVADSLKKAMNENDIVDADGKKIVSNGSMLSIWRTRDLPHALLLIEQLHELEYIQNFYVLKKMNDHRPLYHILIINIASAQEAEKLKDYWERKGFLRVKILEKI